MIHNSIRDHTLHLFADILSTTNTLLDLGTTSSTLCIPFGSPRFADIAEKTLSVDKEFKKTIVERSIKASGSTLTVTFTSESLKMLRTSVSSFFDLTALVARTIAEFGDDAVVTTDP
ncbi:hypothetical protein BASA50_004023 [Batrachochytrium salamandrivorans]|uniref:Transcription factor Pcc1 n=1 Tax=Batrachochytrium salamandrivorans TaxID=1357716 RepID=A0ABQ8FH13_9FUNG|nr:hypothetical protein BASA62_002895 [Batrachochytrium salamandrivorans]KAH6598141.1 hypothetical protein BASA50_004023 [Batrachochytrium salamandrivorans]